MNVERDIAGFALPFAAGVLITAYTGAIFCARFSYIHFISLLVIFCTIALLFRRKELEYGIYMQWGLIIVASLACGVLSAATAISLFDMPESGLEIFSSRVGSGIQGMIDAISFESKEASALIKALLTGEREGLSPEIKTAFRDSGASHILALSGLHLGIIYGILSKSCAVMGNSNTMRLVRSVLIICVCGIYTLATGAGDSLVRAFIFISLREAAKITCRYNGLGQILLASLTIQLVIDPLAIRSISFQLSYAAMAGIAYIYPWLQGFWDRAVEIFRSGSDEISTVRTPDNVDESGPERNLRAGNYVSHIGGLATRPIRWIWNTVALSIACQITTAPLAYIYFGTFPVHFMLTNLLTLPLTGLLIPAALLTLCLTSIGLCPAILVQATEFLVTLLISLLEIISTM